MSYRLSDMKKEGISVQILEDVRDNMFRWKRIDGFGHMLDIEVEEYKRVRGLRRFPESLADIVADLQRRVGDLEGMK